MSIHTYIRRYTLFLTGVILSATGIAFITRAGLGTSPVSGLPFVLSLITSISMGTYTFLFNMTFLMLEAILRRKFTIQQALQIPASALIRPWALSRPASAVHGVRPLFTWSSDALSWHLASALR